MIKFTLVANYACILYKRSEVKKCLTWSTRCHPRHTLWTWTPGWPSPWTWWPWGCWPRTGARPRPRSWESSRRSGCTLGARWSGSEADTRSQPGRGKTGIDVRDRLWDNEYNRFIIRAKKVQQGSSITLIGDHGHAFTCSWDERYFSFGLSLGGGNSMRLRWVIPMCTEEPWNGKLCSLIKLSITYYRLI